MTAAHPNHCLVPPWPGYHGYGAALTRGTAFGVTVGMSRAEAVSVLAVGGNFRRTLVQCVLPSSEIDHVEYDLDDRASLARPDCRSSDGVFEIWEADQSISCTLLFGGTIISEAQILQLLVIDDKIAAIEFQGGGTILG